MQKEQRHIIRKQVFELQLDKERPHHEISEKLKRLFKNVVLPRLSTLFDHIADRRRIQIEKLEIHIPPLNMADWALHFPELLFQEIERQIRAQIRTAQSSNPPTTNPDPAKVHSGQVLEAFIFFCLTGTFPWWYSVDNFEVFENQLLELPVTVLFEALEQYARNEQVSDRLVFQFSDRFLQYITKNKTGIPVSGKELEQWKTLIAKGRFYMLKEKDTIRIIKKSGLKAILQNPFTDDQQEEKFLSHLMLSISEKTAISVTDVALQLIKALKNYAPEWALDKQLKKAIRKYLAQQVNLSEKSQPAEQRTPETLHTAIQDSEKAEAPLSENTPAEDEFYINNSGLVLLWPYFPLFFEKLGLIQNKAFKNIEAQQQAVLISQHLVDGNDKWNEHQLLLNKLLCGYPLWKTLPTEVELTPLIADQSKALLTSVIRYWSILKKTSIEGLRMSFLNREGKLAKAEEEWKLKVAQETYDIVLDQIPWSFRIIKLPWMETMIKVDW